MRTVRAPLRALAEGERELTEESVRYLVRVLRLAPGDGFVAFDPERGIEADARLTTGADGRLRAQIGATRDGRVVAASPLVLVQGLAKGDKVDAVVRDATELGATAIVLAHTARSVVRGTVEGKRERWRRITEEAARQSGRSDVPRVEGPLPWADALATADDCDARFCLDPRAMERLGGALPEAVASGAGIAFAVGPEGGLTAAEVEIAVGQGFLPASMGPFILRTETVAAAVLGAVRVLTVS